VLTGAGLGSAAAATEQADVVPGNGFPADLTGQVGMGAVLVGVFGLAFGLVRHRRQVRRRDEGLLEHPDNSAADTVSMDAVIEVIDSAMGPAAG
jgi:hypothetical protein